MRMLAEETITEINRAENTNELRSSLQKYIQNKGFESYSFLNNSNHGESNPVIISTITEAWANDYRSNNFIDVDPCLPKARVSNLPFQWAEANFKKFKNNKKSRAMQLMDAARDNNLKEGLVIPVHYTDKLGIYYSAICTFFWSSKKEKFLKRLFLDQHEMHMVLIYWAHKMMDLTGPQKPFIAASNLTEREIEILTWAAQGKTAHDTAMILNISIPTVNTHIASSIGKLNASNKTHATAIALSTGIIRP